MTDVLVNQQLFVEVAAAPTTQGAPVGQEIFELDPADQLTFTDFDVGTGGIFQVPVQVMSTAGTLDLPMDIVATAGVLYLRVEAACGIQFVNGLGTSPIFQLNPGRWSALHMQFTGIVLVNTSTTAPVKGRYCVAGAPT